MKKKLLVLGSGEMGLFYCKVLSFNYDCMVYSSNPKRVDELRKFGFAATDQITEAHDIYFFAIEEKRIIELFKSNKKIFSRKGIAIIDISSTKGMLSKFYPKLKSDCEILSIHPMHSANISSLAGMTICAIPVRKGRISQEFLESLSLSGAKLFESDFEEHEKAMLSIQVITHFSLLTAAKTITDIGMSTKDLQRFYSPVFVLFLSSISRLLTQKPSVYQEIQELAGGSEKARKAFLKNAEELAVAVKDKASFEEYFNNVLRSFSDVEYLRHVSSEMVEKARNHRNSFAAMKGKFAVVLNLKKQKTHSGILVDISGDNLFIAESDSALRAFSQVNSHEHKSIVRVNENYAVYLEQETAARKLSETKRFDITIEASRIDPGELIASFSGMSEYILKVEHLSSFGSKLTLRFYVFSPKGLESFVDSRFEEQRIRKRLKGLGVGIG